MPTGTAQMTSNQKVSLIQRYFPQKTFPSGVWQQYDGGFISWTPWWQAKYNDPDGGKAENCAHVHLSEDELAGQWGNAHCSNAYHYICERGF